MEASSSNNMRSGRALLTAFKNVQISSRYQLFPTAVTRIPLKVVVETTESTVQPIQ